MAYVKFTRKNPRPGDLQNSPHKLAQHASQTMAAAYRRRPKQLSPTTQVLHSPRLVDSTQQNCLQENAKIIMHNWIFTQQRTSKI